MTVKRGCTAAVFVGLMGTMYLGAQQRRPGGFVPGQERPPGDPAQIARGKALYSVDCTSCHGADLRGGDIGGPNLLRSQVALSDQNGELILPIIQGSRQSQGMPAIEMSREDGLAVAAYVRSVVATIGRQGMPPSVGQEPPSILVGNARAGQTYFDSKCGRCHSATGDLKGIATRITDPKALQNRWVAGGGGRPRRGVEPLITVTATVTLNRRAKRSKGGWSESTTSWSALAREDGSVRTFRREGDMPKVEVHDPLKAHRDLLAVLHRSKTCTT